MRRFILCLGVVFVSLVFLTDVSQAQQRPEFKLGFKALAEQIPAVVGEPQENERWGANGDSIQKTSNGLMVWRKADNWTAFTNGHMTWINGPDGVQSRFNNERFSWEKEPSLQPVSAVPTATSAPALPTPTPTPAPPKTDWRPGWNAVASVPIIGAIDGPKNDQLVSYGNFSISGWATDPGGQAVSFQVFADGLDNTGGKRVDTSFQRRNRPDVAQALKNPAYTNSGFTVYVNSVGLAPGRHTFNLYAQASQGGWWIKSVNVMVPSAPPTPTPTPIRPESGYVTMNGKQYLTETWT